MAGQTARLGLVLLALMLSGCYAATRSTVFMVEADQRLAEAQAAGAPTRAVYAWTKAEQYLVKARDEWGRSEFQSAERMCTASKKWSEEAARIARAAGPADELDTIPDDAPPTPPAAPVDGDADEDPDDDGAW
jgi:hypothetical protein